jgi:PAS domain S-box-containing protein
MLNPEQIEILRACSKDEQAFAQIHQLVTSLLPTQSPQAPITAHQPTDGTVECPLHEGVDCKLEERYRRVTAALQESEERTRSVLDNVKDSIFQTDAQGYLTFLNPAWEEITGFPIADSLGRSFLTFVHPQEQQINISMFQEMIAGGINSSQHEVRHLTHGGDYRWFEVHVHLTRDEQQNVIGTSGILRDVTRQKQTLDALRESEKRYRGLIESQIDLIVRVAPDGTFTFVNDVYCETFGKRREELLGNTFMPLVHEDDLAATLEAMQGLEAPPYRVYLEQRAYTAYGWRWLAWEDYAIKDEEGRTIEIQAIGRDITDRKQAEEALMRRDSILEAVGFAAEQFLRIAPLAQSIPLVLEHLGKATQVSRVYIFQNDVVAMSDDAPEQEVLVTSQQYEWCAPGVEPQIDNPELQGVPFEAAGLWRWVELMQQGQTVYGKVRTFPADEREVLEPQNILSLAAVPIYVGQQWWGFMGFDDCEHDHTWTLPEIDTLKAAAGILGAAIQRDQVQADLRESQLRYQAIVEDQTEIICRFRMDGTFTFTNEAFCRYFGKQRAEVIGQVFVPDMPQEDRQKVRHILASLSADHPVHTIENRIFLHNGDMRWQQWTFHLIGDAHTGTRGEIQAVGRDITERVQTEEELLRVNAAVDSTSDAISIADMSQQIIYVNTAFRDMYGYTAEQLNATGGFRAMFEPPETAAHIFAAMQNRHSWNGEVSLRTQDGQIIPTLLRADCVLDQEQDCLGFVSVCTDITVQKKVEEDLIAASEAALEASRLKSEFLANMSHEIRTPLNAIIGMTGLMLETQLDTEQQEIAETVRTSGDTLLMLINDILDFSKIEAGRLDLEYHPFHLRECVEESLDLVVPHAAEKQLELACSISETVPPLVLGDVTRMRQILLNLLSNAVKFTEQGEVVVSVESYPVNPLALTATEQGHNEVPQQTAETTGTSTAYEIHFAVRDTGIGIPRNRMNRLFQSFSQVDSSVTRKYGGTGLGLTISKALIEAMGGTISVESEEGLGTTFHFTIRSQTTSAETRHQYQHEKPHLVGTRVLIVDDNETNRHILTRQMRSWGMQPQAASSGAEALEWIRQGQSFNIGILDMYMPEMDGVTLASEIRALHSAQEFPLMMLTSVGKTRGGDMQAAGFAATMSKPVKPSQLYNVLISLLNGQSWPAERATALPEDIPPTPPFPLRILIAEDHAVNQKVALRLLKRLGYRADVAANGLEVLDALERQSYDVILMDVQMPEMDGVEATSRIRQLLPPERQPHIVAITAHAMKGSRERYLAAGMDNYISKPVRLEELATVLYSCHPLATTSRVVRQPAASVHKGPAELSPAPPSIDEHIIREMFVEVDDATEIEEMQEIITLFFDTTPDMMTHLHQAVAQRDAQTLRQVAHTLKGSAQLGILRFSAIAAELQQLGDQGTVEGAELLIAQLQREFLHVEELMEALLERIVASPARG